MCPHPPQKLQPVAVHDVSDIGISISALGEHGRDFLQVGDGVKVKGGFFAAKTAIEISAEGGVVSIPG
jgi:hypothetical protein